MFFIANSRAKSPPITFTPDSSLIENSFDPSKHLGNRCHLWTESFRADAYPNHGPGIDQS